MPGILCSPGGMRKVVVMSCCSFWLQGMVIWVRSGALVVFGWFGTLAVLCLVVCAVIWVSASVLCRFGLECGDLD